MNAFSVEYNSQEIAWLYGFRGKVWQQAEWRLLCREPDHLSEISNSLNHLSTINNQSSLLLIDPSFAFTQSKKLWQPDISSLVLKHYTKLNIFHIQSQQGIVSTQLGFLQSSPTWASFVSQSTAFHHQLEFIRLYPILKSIPGVRSISVVGSHALGIAKSSSDVDIVVHTAFGMTLFVRFWLKIILKITGYDIHSLRWELLLRLSNLFCSPFLQEIAIRKQDFFHKRTGLKIDAGIISDNLHFIEQRFPKVSRNAWLWQGKTIGVDWNYTSFPRSNLNKLLTFFATFFTFITLLVVYPFAIITQLVWSKLLRNKQSDSIVNFSICSFFTPDFPFDQKVQLDT